MFCNSLIIAHPSKFKARQCPVPRIPSHQKRISFRLIFGHRWEHNTSVSIHSDSEVSEGDLQNNHIIVVGRPACNALGARWEKSLPVAFGKGSFEVRGEHYAHPNNAVVCAAANPLNGRYSLVCVAGLSSHRTLRVVPSFEEESLPYAQVVVLPNEKEPQALTLPASEMIKPLR